MTNGANDVLDVTIDGTVARLTITRPDKRNAVSDTLMDALGAFFANPPEDVRIVILSGEGEHFSAGLDLSEHVARDAAQTMRHSRNWHRIMDMIQFGGLPVISVLKGAVIGGGLELAAATHIRIADPSTFYQLPEGRRGIFVGGGASVRIGKILGADRMIEMMLTGRKYTAEDGLRLGLSHYVCDSAAEAEAKANELAAKVADNAQLSNYIMIQALARIEDMAKADGLFTESLCAALTQTSDDAQEGLNAFLEKRAPNFK
ncbi:enoyl-CoA hydratase [Thalassospira profundimaris]|uniref:Enoyl-CoA hydratase n=1 Tax=Thalassospira profundimaris TaxID=502049 RepID=A0A367WYL4_9PROT|nr:crotonase/enoyl-CoA hydratase family protein [Thalassospira profundimaris]RCK46524.1 enoyl-CoA hydratase [Thalassospira profundimaris]